MRVSRTLSTVEMHAGGQSVIGTPFGARVLAETQVGEFRGVIPEVRGSAHGCGLSNWIIEDRDPLRHGFLVR